MESLKTPSLFHTCSQLHLVCPLGRNISASTTVMQTDKIQVSCIHCLYYITCNSLGLEFIYSASNVAFAFGSIRLQYSPPKNILNETT